jgi:putative ABC transport system permease protein
VKVPISWQKFEDDGARWEFFRGLRDSLSRLPGVEQVGATSHVPLAGGMLTGTYAYDAATRERWGGIAADYRIVLPGYFQTMRTPLLNGRVFEDLDAQSALRAVVVDESLARQAWPGENAVGKTLTIVLSVQDQQQQEVEVIGVTRHASLTGLRESGSPQIYVPYWLWQRGEMSYVLRASTPPMGLVPAVRQQVAQAGGGRPAHTFQAMEGVVSHALSDVQFAVVLLALFAGMAAVLSAVGLYGIVAYSVSQRTREIGIRVALGAGPGQILRLVLRSGVLFTACGILAGLPVAAVLTRLLSSMLWRVSPMDPQTFVVIPVFLAAVALLACCIPARRALQVEPLLALRHE